MTAKKWKIGILGTASVARYALIGPARERQDCEVVAVGSRDSRRAADYARKNNIQKSYGSYEELITSPEVDVVYVALPNHMHFEWSMKALEASKHVLCEKPMASNGDQARKMVASAQASGRVLMEALHSTHHPLYPRLREIVRSGELGKVKQVRVDFCSLLPFRNNIRFKYELAGGANMDIGCYSVQLVRYLLGEEPVVDSASARLVAPEVDGRIEAKMHCPSGIEIRVACSLIELPWNIRMKIEVEGENATLKSINPFAAHLFHTLTIRSKDGKVRKEKIQRKPSSYAHQLEHFLKLLDGQVHDSPSSASEAVKTLDVMDAMYTKSGLRLRGLSSGAV